jgi:transcriptional regulator with XRE-family HTH domain
MILPCRRKLSSKYSNLIYNPTVNKKETFHEYIKARYKEWQEDRFGQSASIQQYANYIGVSQGVMTNWLKGIDTPKAQKSISALAKVYGSEIYTLLELEPPAPTDELLASLANLLRQFRPEQQPAVSQAIQETLKDLLDKGKPDITADNDQVMALLARKIIKKTTREGLTPPEVLKKIS